MQGGGGGGGGGGALKKRKGEFITGPIGVKREKKREDAGKGAA
eukprot:COSAG02_NODE_539_length_20605_cov_93.802155_16_plen_42_part_01